MEGTRYPKRASLEGLVSEIFKLVSRGATHEQWAEWLRVPLEHAAADGNIDLFNALIEAGADGSAGWRGCEGRTLFDAAAVGGNAEVVSGLVAAGAQPDVSEVSASSRRSALYLATSLGHEEAARGLVKTGADVDFYDPYDGCYVLFKAAECGYEELVKDLLLGGADPDACSGWRKHTPLHIAAGSGFDGIASMLLAWGADKDALDDYDVSPLMMAADKDHLSTVNILLAAGGDIEVREDAGYTAFDIAAKNGHVGIAKATLGHEVDVNAADKHGDSAIHRAADDGEAGVIHVLVKAGADIELKGLGGRTPLFGAVDFNWWCEATRALLHHGASLKVQDDQGNTPLHAACCRRQQKSLSTVVDLLLRSGADETTVNNDGKTPAQTLESLPSGWPLRQCFTEEKRRAQLLLARAPNDRAWRRRCWLVFLRSRASRARTAGCDIGGASGHGSDATDDGGQNMVARSEHTGEGAHCVVGQAGSGCATGFGEGGSLSSLVASLIGLELEGVFRTVVGFL